MSDSTKPVPEPNAPKRSRVQRFARWCAKWAARAFVALLVFAFVGREGCRHFGQRGLRAEVARLDAEDPGWQLPDIVAARDRTAPPEDQNSARVVRAARAGLTQEWTHWTTSGVLQMGDPGALNRKQHFADFLSPDPDVFAGVGPARELAHALSDMPTGFHPVSADANVFELKLTDTQSAREVVALLQADALYAAQTGNPRRALRASRAALNAGRSIGDEPTLISILVRIAAAHVCAETAIRTLALGNSKGADAELEALQIALLREMDEPLLLIGLRGERAMMHNYFESIDRVSGSDEMLRMLDEKPSFAGRGVWYFRLAFLPEDRRRYLALMSKMVDAARGPAHKLLPVTRSFEDDVRASRDIRYLFHGLMLPAVQKVAEVSLRHRAECGSTAVLLACERFRLKHGRFPDSLAELPKDLLEAVPPDPYTGAPLKFTRTPDGVAVYADAPKGAIGFQRDGEVRLTAPLGGDEYGWRLFDVKHRGLPPKADPEPELP